MTQRCELPLSGPFLDFLPLGETKTSANKSSALEIDVEQLGQQLTATARNSAGKALKIIRQNGRLSAWEYETSVYSQGLLPVRSDSTHDILNLCTWCVWPQTKAALNALQIERGRDGNTGQRSPAGDAGTLLDECGVIVAAPTDEIETLIRGHHWNALFVADRHLWNHHLKAWAFGHGLLEQMLSPYDGIMGKCVVLTMDRAIIEKHAGPAVLDPLLSQAINTINRPRQLLALPVLGIPGWYSPNNDHAYYDNTGYFRP